MMLSIFSCASWPFVYLLWKNVYSNPSLISFKNKFTYLFLAALGLHCCMRAFSSRGEWGLLFVAVCGLLIEVASLVAEHGALGARASVGVARRLSSCGSQALECRLSSCGTQA